MQRERERAGKQGVRLGLTLSAVGIEAVGGLLRGEEGKKPKYTKCMGDVRVCKVSTSELLTANVILHCQGVQPFGISGPHRKKEALSWATHQIHRNT